MLFCLYRAKYAIAALKKKLNDKNPHVALYALEVGVVLLTHMTIILNNLGFMGEPKFILIVLNLCVVQYS